MKSGLTRCPTLTAPLFPGVSMLPFRCDPGGGRKQQVSCRVARLKEPAPAVLLSDTGVGRPTLFSLSFHIHGVQHALESLVLLGTCAAVLL